MTALAKTATRSAETGAAYADDFYTWTQEQGARLRAGDLTTLDLENLAEEIESLGKSEFSSLVVAFREILKSMLIIDRCPGLSTRDAALKIVVQRLDGALLIADSPGLAGRADAAMTRAYQTARLRAAGAADLPLSHFPETCPYGAEEVLNRIFAIDSDDGAG